jgi:macrodomain Ter protein organizer (MatP/YcbG family)
MNETNDPTTRPQAADLEAVEHQSASKRAAVISVRLEPADAMRLGDLAKRAGMTLSEYARQVLKETIDTSWKVRTSGNFTAVVGRTSPTGGTVSISERALVAH